MFGYTAKQTLDYAQSLYEKKLLTYPRTDSRFLTADMAETASVVLHLAAKVPPFDGCGEFFPDVSLLVNDKKVSDHHAIIPTLELEKADLSELPVGERNPSAGVPGAAVRGGGALCVRSCHGRLYLRRAHLHRQGAAHPLRGLA